MSPQRFAFTCGHLTIPHGFLIEGAKDKLRVPVHVYRITHPRGRVLFDSGLHLAVQTDAALKRFAVMEAAGARVMVGHDPAFWASVPQAPLHLA